MRWAGGDRWESSTSPRISPPPGAERVMPFPLPSQIDPGLPGVFTGMSTHAGIGAMSPTSSSLMLLTRSLTGAMVIVPV